MMSFCRNGLDLLLERIDAERLDDVAVDAGAQGFDNVVLRGVGRHHQDRRFLRFVERRAAVADELDAVHLGHVPVRDHHVDVGRR